MTDSTHRNRRDVLRIGLGALAAASMPVLPRVTLGAELPQVSPDDPAPKALAYVHDAGTVEAAVRGGERSCADCNFFTEPDAEWGPCTLFPGKAVARQGWCRGWVARP